MQAVLTRNTQILHSTLADHVTPFGSILRPPSLYEFVGSQGLAALNAADTRQAEWIAYIDDFKLMFVLTVVSLPLLLLSTGRRSAAGAIALE